MIELRPRGSGKIWKGAKWQQKKISQIRRPRGDGNGRTPILKCGMF